MSCKGAKDDIKTYILELMMTSSVVFSGSLEIYTVRIEKINNLVGNKLKQS